MIFHQLSHHIICFLNIGLKGYELASLRYQWKVEKEIRDGSRASQTHKTRKDMRNIKFCSSFLQEKYMVCTHCVHLLKFWQQRGFRGDLCGKM